LENDLATQEASALKL